MEKRMNGSGGKIMTKVDAHIEKIKEALQLPNQFCNTCTLKEGTVIVVICLQIVSLMFVSFLLTLMIVYPTETTKWWEEKWASDFDPYINNENMELINKLYPLWMPVAQLLVAVEGAYFFSGFVVLYAIWKKKVGTLYYLPWLMLTGLLVASNFFTVLSMVIFTFVISGYREITVTWDMVPTICTFVYACLWSYAFFVVLAHYKRRVIVKWWRDYNERQKQ